MSGGERVECRNDDDDDRNGDQSLDRHHQVIEEELRVYSNNMY